jgi:hypothetical protein
MDAELEVLMDTPLDSEPLPSFKPGMPSNQKNAHLSDQLVMRVGIPHKGGALSFHAFNESYPVMVSASAFWSPKTNSFAIPEATNLTELDMALDSAGFTAMANWKAKGTQPGMAGIFPWSYGAYIELASMMSPAWYSQPDACCEPEIASSQEEIDYRINVTATLLEGSLRVCYAWQNELARECSPGAVANLVPIPVPVLQGWSASDYLRSLDLLMQVWQRWEPWIAPPALIGIGSVCRRSLKDPNFGLHAILAALEGKLPSQSKLHCFGVKGSVLSELKMLDWVGSADSMAYDFGARIKARKGGHSNSMAHRSKEMTDWMSAAARRIQPAAGDQFRLLFA